MENINKEILIALSETAAAVVLPSESAVALCSPGLWALYQSFSETSTVTDKVRPHLL